MKKGRLVVLTFWGLCGLTLFGEINPSYAQTDNLTRDLEPVLLRGSDLSDFLTIPANQLFVYAFTYGSSTWNQIPFQIDDVGSDESYFSEADGILDANDEIVFMAKDAGDKASPSNWIGDVDATTHPRMEIQVHDGNGHQAWVYIYRSATLTYTPGQDYVQADQVNHIISSAQYMLGHTATGAMADLRIPLSGGGTNQDFIDREKIRLVGAVGFISYVLTEDDLLLQNIRYKDGPIRVLREGSYTLTGTGLSYNKAISQRFYAMMSLTGGGIGTISAEYGVTHMRQSLDLNATAMNMQVYTPGNSVLADGSPDVVNTTLPSPGQTWSMVTGSPGSFVQVINLPAIGNPQSLYYFDQAAGGTADGTADTGDGVSYGDIGVSFAYPNIGTFAMGITRFYLPADQPASQGATLASYTANPLQTSSVSQSAPVPHILATRLVNARVVGDDFLWDIEINRQDDWGSGLDATLGDQAFYFHFNAAAFNSLIPALSDLHPGLAGNLNYSLSTGGDAASSTCYVRILLNPFAGGSNWYPPLQSWEHLVTLSLPIASVTEESHLTWLAGLTESYEGSDLLLISELSGSGDILLPVNLILFTASYEADCVNLIWKTASETENLGFHIYRCSEQAPEWARINAELIPGAAFSNSERQYQHKDADVESQKTYWYRLADVNYQGVVTMHKPISIEINQPNFYQLEQNYPNPFNPTTLIRFQISKAAETELTIYNIRGEKVRKLVSGELRAGVHAVSWDGKDETGQTVAAGTFIYRLSSGSFVSSKKMMLVK